MAAKLEFPDYVRKEFDEYEWGRTDCINFAQELLEWYTYETWDIRPEWARGTYREAIKATRENGLLAAYKDGLKAARSVSNDYLVHQSDPPTRAPALFILSPTPYRTYLSGVRMANDFEPMVGAYLGEDKTGLRRGVIMTREGLSEVSGFVLSENWFIPSNIYRSRYRLENA